MFVLSNSWVIDLVVDIKKSVFVEVEVRGWVVVNFMRFRDNF